MDDLFLKIHLTTNVQNALKNKVASKMTQNKNKIGINETACNKEEFI